MATTGAGYEESCDCALTFKKSISSIPIANTLSPLRLQPHCKDDLLEKTPAWLGLHDVVIIQ